MNYLQQSKGRAHDDDRANQTGGGFDFMPEKVFVVPEDQLKLNEQELDEEITKVLTANNPNAPNNITRFSYKE